MSRLALAALCCATVSCTYRSDTSVTAPLGQPYVETGGVPRAPAAGSSLVTDFRVDGSTVFGHVAWSQACRLAQYRDVEVRSTARHGPDVGRDLIWMSAGVAAAAFGGLLVVQGAAGSASTDAKATPPGLLLGAMGAFGMGYAIDGLFDERGEESHANETREPVADTRLTPCGDAAGLARVRLALDLGDAKAQGLVSSRGQAGFVLPVGRMGSLPPRARVVVSGDGTQELRAGDVVGEVDLAPAIAWAQSTPPALHFSDDSPIVTGGVTFLGTGCRAVRAESCGEVGDDDCDGFYDVGCGPHPGSLQWTLHAANGNALELTVVGPDGASVSNGSRGPLASGLAMDPDCGAADLPTCTAEHTQNVYLPVASSPAAGTYRAIVTGPNGAEALLVGRGLGRSYRARLRLRNGQAEIAMTVVAGPATVAVQTRAASRAITALSTSIDTLCALRRSGKLDCYGRAETGQIDRLGLTTTSISLGFSHACAVHSDHRVACWGDNLWGAAGRRGSVEAGLAGDVAGVDGVDSVAAGWDHTCALRTSGGVVCWGHNEHGEMGRIAPDHRSVERPTDVPGIADATALAAGKYFTCAVRRTGDIACWGDGSLGALGVGPAKEVVPVGNVSGFPDFVAVAAGWTHACGLRKTGEVACWGMNGDGQCGDASSSVRDRPVRVAGLADVVSIAAGGETSCAIDRAGAVWCWGNGDSGQLGHSHRSATPVRIALDRPATQVAVGAHFVCAAVAGDRIKCWGDAPQVFSGLSE